MFRASARGTFQCLDAQSEPSAMAESDTAENIYPNCVDFLAFIAQYDTLLLDYIYSEQGVRSYELFGLSSKKHGKDHIAGADERLYPRFQSKRMDDPRGGHRASDRRLRMGCVRASRYRRTNRRHL